MEGLSSLGEGKHTIVFDFKYNGPGPGKGGTGVLSVDGKEVDRKTIEHTIPLLMSIDETFDIGLDTRTPVDFSYDVPFAFTGTIDKLNYKLGPIAVIGRGPKEGGRRNGQSQQLGGQGAKPVRMNPNTVPARFRQRIGLTRKVVERCTKTCCAS